jgi:hypothetical protein
LWCDRKTDSENSNREHIFPEAIGGKKKRPINSICKKCNQYFGDRRYGISPDKYSLDEALKKEHPAFLYANLIDKRLGRIRDKEDRIRKEGEKTRIKGVGESVNVKMENDNSELLMINAKG